MIQHGSNQLALAPSGLILGFNLTALVTICSALGYSEQTLIHLLPHVEAGLKDALKENGSSNSEPDDPDSGH